MKLSRQLRAPRRRLRRQGAIVLGLILGLPAFLLALCVLADIANLWLARVELESGLEAAALAAVKEWGDSQAADTLAARSVGVAYGAANKAAGAAIFSDTTAALNYANGAAPNQNATCDTGLIFGAVTSGTLNPPFLIDTSLQPNCGAGEVLFDVHGNGAGSLDAAPHNAWGFAFRSDGAAAALRVAAIVIDLQGGGGAGRFDLAGGGPQLSSATPAQYAVRDTSGNGQPDILGFSDPAAQITFSPVSGSSPTLTITFSADGVNDDGFAPGDRFRFGVGVAGVHSGDAEDDGDGVGRDHATVTVHFNNGAVVTGRYGDDLFARHGNCVNPAQPAPSGSLITHPSQTPDLPCPNAPTASDNGQSWGSLAAGSRRPHAVRVQSSVEVASICKTLFGSVVGPFVVRAEATAMYDCSRRLPRLIRVSASNFHCP